MCVGRRVVGGIASPGSEHRARRGRTRGHATSPRLASTQTLDRIVIRRDARESKDKEWRLANPHARHAARDGERQRGADDRTTSKVFHTAEACGLSYHAGLESRFLCVAVVAIVIHDFGRGCAAG